LTNPTTPQQFCKFFAKRNHLHHNDLEKHKGEPFCKFRVRFVAFLQKRVKLRTMARKRKHKNTISRGLTAADYHRLRRRILAGEMTWELAEQIGLCFPQRPARKPLGRPRKQPGRVASTPKGDS
jgi:hypothetical protein